MWSRNEVADSCQLRQKTGHLELYGRTVWLLSVQCRKKIDALFKFRDFNDFQLTIPPEETYPICINHALRPGVKS